MFFPIFRVQISWVVYLTPCLVIIKMRPSRVSTATIVYIILISALRFNVALEKLTHTETPVTSCLIHQTVTVLYIEQKDSQIAILLSNFLCLERAIGSTNLVIDN